MVCILKFYFHIDQSFFQLSFLAYPKKNPASTTFESSSYFLAEALKTTSKKNKAVQALCAAILLSSFVTDKKSAKSRLSKSGNVLSLNDNHSIIQAITHALFSVDPSFLNFDISDIWDGTLITILCKNIMDDLPVSTTHIILIFLIDIKF